MNKRFFLFLITGCFLFFTFVCKSQSPKVKYWISFKNKNGTAHSLNNPESFLTSKSVSRRSNYNIPYHFSDLPVTRSYIVAIDTIKHVDVMYTSKWLNGVVVAIDSAAVASTALSAIRSFSFVQDTNRVKRYRLTIEPGGTDSFDIEKSSAARNTSAQAFNYGGASAQIRQLRVDCLHEKGIRGQGITIAVMDVGFNNVDSSPVFDSIRNNGGILGTRDFVSGGTYAYHGGEHGTNVFSTLAGNVQGVIMGTAPMAKYWLMRTEDVGSETLVEEYNWIRAAEFADSVGVDIITTSLGYFGFDIHAQDHAFSTLDGKHAPMSIAATMAARKGIFVLNAAGNEGGNIAWGKHITVPSDADSICTVGAVDTLGNYAPFSSIGPTADNRIKPDLVAVGQGAWVCNQAGLCFPGNGTSFATPILAGAVACYWQNHRWLNNMQVLDALKKSATNALKPNNTIGWGIPVLCRRDLDFEMSVSYNPNTSLLTVMLSESQFEKITLEIYDITGKLLFSNSIDISSERIETNLTIVADGVYLAKVKTSKGTKSAKFLK